MEIIDFVINYPDMFMGMVDREGWVVSIIATLAIFGFGGYFLGMATMFVLAPLVIFITGLVLAYTGKLDRFSGWNYGIGRRP